MDTNIPWNKGKTVGQKKPFTIQQVRFIEETLRDKGELRDLALFSCAKDTMLRASDLLKLKVEDIRDTRGKIKGEFYVRQRKTDKGILVSLSPETKRVLEEWIRESGKSEGDYLFTGLKGVRRQKPLTYEHYSRLVKYWARLVHLDPKDYSTHSLRRSKAAYIYKKTQNPELVRQLLGQKSITATSHYLNIGQREAIEVAREVEF